MNFGIKLSSIGASLPEKVVTNSDLVKLFDTSDEWIYTRTGIRERRVVSGDESGLSLSVNAANEAISIADLNPTDIDLIIVATCTPDNLYPSMACSVQAHIGAVNACAFDLSAACSGFIYGIITASQFIFNGTYKNILLVGVDIHSRFLDWSDRNVSILFGDGAGAVVLSRTSLEKNELLSFEMKSRSDIHCDLTLDNKNIFYPESSKTILPSFVKMNGKAIYQFACDVVPEISESILKKADIDVSAVDYFIPHQANKRIIDSAAKRLGISSEKIISNIHKVGNTSSASIPLALYDGISSAQIKTPATALLVGFGAGLTWAGAVMRINLKT